MQLERNQKILISKDVTVDATTLDNLANGELAVLKPDGTFLSAGETVSDAPYIYIVQGSATLGNPKFSAKIIGREVIGWRGTSYAAPVAQVSYVGYNGTNGNIEASVDIKASTTYTLAIIFKQDKVAFSERQLKKTFSYATSAASDSRESVVNAFVALINADATCAEYLTAAKVGSGATVGISLTAKAQTYNAIDGYNYVNFETVLGDGFTVATQLDEYGYRYVSGAAGTTSSAISVSPDKGVGYYQQVRDLETFILGNSGITNRRKFPIPSGEDDVVAESTEAYDMYVIDSNNTHSSADLGKTTTEPLQTIIAIPYDAAAGNGAEFESLINPWMESVGFAAVNL